MCGLANCVSFHVYVCNKEYMFESTPAVCTLVSLCVYLCVHMKAWSVSFCVYIYECTYMPSVWVCAGRHVRECVGINVF